MIFIEYKYDVFHLYLQLNNNFVLNKYYLLLVIFN
jgi:hypothetical protein